MADTIHSVDSEGPLLVIGAGLGRTGTYTLKCALETLYSRPCYHMQEILISHKHHIQIWTDKFEQMLTEEKRNEFTLDELDRIFRRYRAVTDLPGCAVYKELIHAYPDAKVILTVRDDKEWVKSMRSTVRPRKPHLDGYILGNFLLRITSMGEAFKMLDLSLLAAFGRTVDLSDDSQIRQAFNAWNEEVVRTVPSDRLLVFELKDGWEPLCRFLGLAVPNKPFPHTNDTATMQKTITGIYRFLRVIQFGTFSTIVGSKYEVNLW